MERYFTGEYTVKHTARSQGAGRRTAKLREENFSLRVEKKILKKSTTVFSSFSQEAGASRVENLQTISAPLPGHRPIIAS